MQVLKKILWVLFILPVVLGGVFGGGYLFYLWQEADKDIQSVVDYRPNLTTKIVDTKGRLIANLYDKEFRIYTHFNEIPPRMVEALLAVEDTLFFEHNGVNLDAILRAFIKNLRNQKYAEGGSTLTQQLVKNMLLTRAKTLDRKLKEIVLSLKLERVLSKEQILERYFNQTFFGHGFYGIKTAALGYFKKPLALLSLKEIAMLVALPRAPSFYDPTRRLEFSLARANGIIKRMYDLGWISQKEMDVALNEVPKVYHTTTTQNVAPYVVDEVVRTLGFLPDLKTGGYTIKLYIDLDYQRFAQESLKLGYTSTLRRLHEKEDSTLNGAMVVTETKSGHILALVGGVDHQESAFNRATQTKRQFGSAVKPFIYQIAFDNGLTSASLIPDMARSFDNRNGTIPKKRHWRPRNYNYKVNGLVTLQQAMTHSLNLATINLVDYVGFGTVYGGLSSFGFEDLPKNMSIALGSFGISPLEASMQYSLFSNYGSIVEPTLIESVTDARGQDKPLRLMTPKNILSQAQAFLTLSVLKNVVEKGTGHRAQVPGLEIAGKTGTSNNYVDAWFCGFSPSLQAIVWFGRDDNTSIGQAMTGGVVAAPVFGDFMKKVLKFDPNLKRHFDVPEDVVVQHINGETYYTIKGTAIPQQSQSTSPLLF
ncbi:PBP1A family penicillin-binding protein [Helicobacter sp. NHP22-001]|uniref:transglycosylase domain-containing protein n=1 Tax=Helicobacter sp. NHP22-001 TaxID=3040202 RepID=UPI00244D7D9D|nr:PBP1A family penicillin-binding protein [Helicobacter sp. NHP22-001]GMB96160.1 Penicillin-binding protein 1A [Helicobacter sp. NHP22-001]